MTRSTEPTTTPRLPGPLGGRAAWLTVLAIAALAVARVAGAQATEVAAPAAATPVPFAVGEELTFRATFGVLRAGTARMRVDGIDTVRGRAAYHVVFAIDGGIPLFRVHDRYESWIDVATLASLRHRQQISEGRYHRTTTYEIYPEIPAYRKDADSLVASVSRPLDDGSFIYAVRAVGIEVGETRREERYFRPDRNPVVLTGVRRETVTVPAGSFLSVVVAPTIRTKGLFAEGGEARVWLSDDEHRYPLRVESRFAGFSLTLALQSIANLTATELAAARRPDR